MTHAGVSVAVPVPAASAVAGGIPPTAVVSPAAGTALIGELNYRAEVRPDPGYEPPISAPIEAQVALDGVAFVIAVFALVAARRLRNLGTRILMLTFALAALASVA